MRVVHDIVTGLQRQRIHLTTALRWLAAPTKRAFREAFEGFDIPTVAGFAVGAGGRRLLGDDDRDGLLAAVQDLGCLALL